MIDALAQLVAAARQVEAASWDVLDDDVRVGRPSYLPPLDRWVDDLAEWSARFEVAAHDSAKTQGRTYEVDGRPVAIEPFLRKAIQDCVLDEEAAADVRDLEAGESLVLPIAGATKRSLVVRRTA